MLFQSRRTPRERLSAVLFLFVLSNSIFAEELPTSQPADPHGDALPAGALRRFGNLALSHAEEVGCVCYSPDGKWVASGGIDGTVVVWDAATGAPIRILPGESFFVANPAAFSSDGKLLATVLDADKSICLWDTATWELAGRLHGHSDVVVRVAFSPDGKTLASCSGAYHSDGEKHPDFTVRLWDVAARKLKFTLSGHKAGVMGLAWSPDGTIVASGGWDCRLILWDATSGKLLRQLETSPKDEPKTETVVALAFSMDGKRLISGSFDTCIRHWDVASGAEVKDLLHNASGWVSDVVVLPSGKSYVTADYSGAVTLWDIDTANRIRTMMCGNFCDTVAVSPDGKTLVSGNRDNAVRFWDVETGQQKLSQECKHGSVYAIVFSPDGSRIVTGHHDGSSILWNVQSGAVEQRFSGNSKGVKQLFWNGAAVTSVGWDKKICTWNPATGAELRQIEFPRQHSRLSLDPASGAWTTVTDSGDVVLLDGQSGAVRQTAEKNRSLENTHGSVNDHTVYEPCLYNAVFEPGGERIVAGDSLGSIYAWNLAANTLSLVAEKKADESYDRLEISPDGRFIAAMTQNTLRVIEWASGKQLFKVDGYGAVAFAPDSRTIAIGQRHIIALIDVFTGKERLRLPGHRSQVGQSSITALAFSLDGRRLASGGSDGTALLWNIQPKAAAAPAPLNDADLLRAWEDLAADPPAAFSAVNKLIAADEPAVALLRARVEPDNSDALLGMLVAELDDDEFSVREKAAEKLTASGPVARQPLTQLLQSKTASAEARSRAKAILANLPGAITDAQTLRRLRGILVLEHLAAIGTAGARETLEQWSKSSATSMTSREAGAALKRYNAHNN